MADGAAISGATVVHARPDQRAQGQDDHRARDRLPARLPEHRGVLGCDLPRSSRASSPTPTAPTISGDPRVDSTLTAHPGSWAPGPVTLSYRWQADGAARRRSDRPHADPRSRPGRQGDQGRGDRDEDRLHRRQGALRRDRTRWRPARCVRPHRRPSTASPSRARRCGSGRSAVTRPPRGQVRWSRDYALVPGATAATYRLTAADLGHRIRAVVYLDRPGYKQMVVPHGVHPRGQHDPGRSGSRRRRATSAWPSGPPLRATWRPEPRRHPPGPLRAGKLAPPDCLCATALPRANRDRAARPARGPTGSVLVTTAKSTAEVRRRTDASRISK